MKNGIGLFLVLSAFGALLCGVSSTASWAADARVELSNAHSEQRVRYYSGKNVYVEELLHGQWLGRYWSANGRVEPEKFWKSDAFEIRIKQEPSPASIMGTLISTGWELKSTSELTKGLNGSRHFVIELSNKKYPVGVKVHTLLDGTPVIARWLDVTNVSKKPIALTACYPWSGRLWYRDADVAWAHSTKWVVPWEGWLGWDTLKSGLNVYKNDHGLVWDDPYFVLRNESNGEYFFGQLAWPVNFAAEFMRQDGLSFKMGPTAVNALRVIAPGETITTPAMHMGYVKQDFDAAVQAMHEHIRRSVVPKRDPKRAYLVQCLFPEDQPLSVYRGDQCNEANLKTFIDVCAAVGIELFILDGPTWAEGYGNWTPKKKEFPNGLNPVREYAHQKNILFGVYAEVEGGRGKWEQTKVWAEHPEWFIERNPDYPWRNFINLAVPEAASYAESELNQIIQNLNVDIYRHDQNGCFGAEGSSTLRDGFMENDYWRYYEAWNGILDRTRSKYPELILQQASGGGSRLELATLGRWDENYTSDRTGYPSVFQMLSGLTVYLPPEVLVTPYGMAGNCRNVPDLVTMLRGAYALGETPVIFNGMLPKSLSEFKPEDMEKFRHYNRLYKTFIRPMLPSVKVWHHAPVNAIGGVESGGWFAMEFTSPDRKKGWATIIRLTDNDAENYILKPKGLDANRRYSVTFDNTSKVLLMHGATLMRDGLDICPPTDPRSELILFEAK